VGFGVVGDGGVVVLLWFGGEKKAHYVVGEFIATDDANMQPAIKKEYTRSVR
jgi:hypothetical protein